MLTIPDASYIKFSSLPGGHRNKLLANIEDTLGNPVSTKVYGLPSFNLTKVPENKLKETCIYPNPTNGIVSFCDQITGIEKIAIITNTGKQVQEITASDDQITYDLPDLPPGFYFIVMIKDAQVIGRQKLVITNKD